MVIGFFISTIISLLTRKAIGSNNLHPASNFPFLYLKSISPSAIKGPKTAFPQASSPYLSPSPSSNSASRAQNHLHLTWNNMLFGVLWCYLIYNITLVFRYFLQALYLIKLLRTFKIMIKLLRFFGMHHQIRYLQHFQRSLGLISGFALANFPSRLSPVWINRNLVPPTPDLGNVKKSIVFLAWLLLQSSS